MLLRDEDEEEEEAEPEDPVFVVDLLDNSGELSAMLHVFSCKF